MAKKKTRKEEIEHEEKYIKFLQKALDSKTFKKNDPEEYQKTKEKYDKAKFRLKILGNKNG